MGNASDGPVDSFYGFVVQLSARDDSNDVDWASHIAWANWDGEVYRRSRTSSAGAWTEWSRV